MTRRDKSYRKDLKQQIYDRFNGMWADGESKTLAKADGSFGGKIFSYDTYDTYIKQCDYFADYIRDNHPECTTLKAAKKYVPEYLQYGVDRGLSAWTTKTQQSALGKLYDIRPGDKEYFDAPQRRREDIKRSRGEAVRDRHFSEKNNEEYVRFCRGTGLRDNIIRKLKGSDLLSIDDVKRETERLEKKGELDKHEKKKLAALKECMEHFGEHKYFIHSRNDKNGRDRISPIIGPDAERIVARMKATAPDGKVWLSVPKNADTHAYRGEYATEIYKMYARDIDKIPYDGVNKGTGRKYQSGVYVCRKDEKGKKLDKEAMKKASKALGHTRIEVVANNYIRGL